MDKTKDARLPFRRKCIQLAAALLYNANLKGFGDASIYQGRIKGLCVPGLNCYSCPGAVAACPLGSLQNALSSVRYRAPLYILGILLLFGLFLGRVVCGFLCPFGLLQELLYKLPVPKIKKNKVTRLFSWFKYVVLAVFVLLLPLYLGIVRGMPVPAFCKYICPAGTLEGGLPLVAGNPDLRKLAGGLFSWKVLLLAVILIGVIVLYRGFCRFLCPLGAVYSLFAGIGMAGVEVDESRCTGCQACVLHCKLDVKKPGDHECIQCGECRSVCGQNAIYARFSVKGGKGRLGSECLEKSGERDLPGDERGEGTT